jgi:PhnB protein
MVSSGTDDFEPTPCMLHLYVEDVDATYRRALTAGATPLRQPDDEFYGDRSAGVEDSWRNQWWLATHVEDVSSAELEARERRFREERGGPDPGTCRPPCRHPVWVTVLAACGRHW